MLLVFTLYAFLIEVKIYINTRNEKVSLEYGGDILHFRLGYIS